MPDPLKTVAKRDSVSKEIHVAKRDTPVETLALQVQHGKQGAYSPKIRAEQMRKYLDSLTQHGNTLQACEPAEISLRTVMNWRAKSDAFRQKMDEAKQLGDLNTLRRYENKMDHEAFAAPFDKVTSILSMFRTKRLDPAYRDNAITNINVAGPAALQFVVHASDDASKQITQADDQAAT